MSDSIGQLTVTERAVIALGQKEREAELTTLALNTVDILTITNADGYQQVHAARMVLKNERIDLEKRGKEARDDATKFSKAVIAEERRLIGLIEPEESRLQKLEDAWEAARAAEKQARIDAELRRVEALRERIAELHGCLTLTPSSGSALIAEHMSDLDKIPVDATFEEFQDQAEAVKTAALRRLAALHAAAVEHEEAQRKLEAERAELAKQRAEQEERDRQERARLAEEERIRKEAQAKADAEAKKERDRLAAEAKAVRDAEAKKLADERAENERKARERQAELDRQAEEQRRANAAEEARLAAQRAEFERQQEAVRPKPARQMLTTPSREEIIAILARHYGVHADVVRYWLSAINWKASAA